MLEDNVLVNMDEPNKSLVLRLDRPTPRLGGAPIMVRSSRSARRLMGRLIAAFQRGEIDGADARTLSYLVTSYVTCLKADEIEERVKQLEQRMEGEYGVR